MDLGMVSNFLAKALSRPEEGAITKAVTTLQVLNALDDDEQLTSLGYAGMACALRCFDHISRVSGGSYPDCTRLAITLRNFPSVLGLARC
jgi:HrpA-like RNA helicase